MPPPNSLAVFAEDPDAILEFHHRPIRLLWSPLALAFVRYYRLVVCGVFSEPVYSLPDDGALVPD